MGVQFILGRSGTGKTAYIRNQIVEAMRADPLGPSILLIQPAQTTFVAERRLTLGYGLPAFARCQVRSIQGLCEQVAADLGGLAMTPVSDLGRRMIIGHLIREHKGQLRYFGTADRQTGVAEQIEQTFGEFERSGMDSEALLYRLQNAHVESEALADKLHDLSLLYAKYAQYLGQDKVDPHQRMCRLAESLKDWRPAQAATVYVDAFHAFTAAERRVLIALALRTRKMFVAMTIDPDSMVVANIDHFPKQLSAFHPAEMAYRKLAIDLRTANVPVDPPLLMTAVRRFESEALKAIERGFADPDQAVAELGIPAAATTTDTKPDDGHSDVARADQADVFLTIAPSRQAEASAVARDILNLLASGWRQRDIAVLVRDAEAYARPIQEAFDEHGIGYFIDRRRPAGYHPLVRLVRGLLAAAEQGIGTETMLAIARTGLAGLDTRDSDLLEDYVRTHPVPDAAWGANESWAWGRPATIDGGEGLNVRPDELRRHLVGTISTGLQELKADSRTFIARAEALYALLQSLKSASSLGHWIEQASTPEARQEHSGIWKSLMDLLDEMVDLLGDQPATVSQFADVVRSGLDEFDLAITPPTRDQVLVGSVKRTRMDAPRAVFVMGLNEGEFPRSPDEGTVFSDADRKRLAESGAAELEPDADRRLLDERFLIYQALTSASKRLFVSHCTADEGGKEVGASAAWTRLVELLPGVSPGHAASAENRPLDQVATPRQLVSLLLKSGRAGRIDAEADRNIAAAYHQLVTEQAAQPPGKLLASVWGSLGYDYAFAAPPEEVKKLHEGRRTFSCGDVQTYASCPFRYHMKVALGATEGWRDKPEASKQVSWQTQSSLGGLINRIARDADQRKSWTQLDGESLVRQIQTVVEEKVAYAVARNGLADGMSKYLVRRVLEVVERMLLVEADRGMAGNAAPIGANVQFGPGSELLGHRVAVPRGPEITIEGKIDRIDRLENGQTVLYGYAISAASLNLAKFRAGLLVQLPVWLKVLQSQENIGRLEQTGPPLQMPAAAVLIRAQDACETVKSPDDSVALKRVNGSKGVIAASGSNFGGVIGADCPHGTSKLLETRPELVEGYVLATVDKVLQEVIADLLNGKADISPYKLGSERACTFCPYRSVCRFETGFGGYRIIPPEPDDLPAKLVEPSETKSGRGKK